MRRAGLIFGAVLVMVLLGSTSAVQAQDYPPPTDPPGPAIAVRGSVSCGVTLGVADRRSPIEVEASAGYADPNETGEVSVIYNPTVRVGTFTARSDGSFLHTFVLPEEVPAGNHIVRVSLNSRGDTNLSLRVTDAVHDCETEVLGTQATPSVASGVSDGGLLPKTGIDLLILILWALILILLGTVLVASSWRWAQRFEPVRVAGARVLRAPPSPRSMPANEVPHIDTSSFDPVRRARSRGSASSRSAASQPARPAPEWDTKPRRRRKT